MKFELLHPREKIVRIIKRIYDGEMTTLSGGNLSVIDENDTIWITPAGVDKGNLHPQDIVAVYADGTREGKHAPSSEYPFHRAIYGRRPDLRAIVHAHPPALIAYSIARKVPDTRIFSQVYKVCGPIGYAPYGMTGSEKLGENIAITFSGGFNIAMLENHGVVCGGEGLVEAFQRMETLEFCARTLINANSIGDYSVLSEMQLDKFTTKQGNLEEFVVEQHSSMERQLRQDIVDIVHRACDRQLMCSTEGVVSARLSSDSFLITPTNVDRGNLEIEEVVLIKNNRRERGKHPSRAVKLHQAIYDQNEEVNSVITSQSPHAMAFSITPVAFESHTIPESYIMLRDVPRLSFEELFDKPEDIARVVSKSTPVLIVENDSVLTSGTSVLEAFDRLEVLEYSAISLIYLPLLGELKPIEENRIREIEEKFFK